MPKVSENRGGVEGISAGERIHKEIREIGLVTHDDRVNLSNAPTVQNPVQTYVYECHGGFSFIARIGG